MPFILPSLGRRKKAVAPKVSDAARALALAQSQFGEQYRRLQPQACLFAAPHVRKSDVEDVVDAAFSDLWNSCYAEGRADLTTVDGLFWRILRCAIVDYLNEREEREAREVREDPQVIDITEHLDQRPGIEEQLDAEDFEKEIAMIVAVMPKQRAKVFELARKHDWDARAVAEELGIAHNTVRWHLSKAYEMVRASLEPRGYAVPTALPKGRRIGRES
jgi:RNA polymerase sigma factor (sigma-70 family)